MTLHEIATPYNDTTRPIITGWLNTEQLEISLNRFESYIDQVLFFEDNTLFLASTIESKGRTIMPPKTFIKTYYQHIEEETINYRRYLGLPQLVNPVFPDNTEL